MIKKYLPQTLPFAKYLTPGVLTSMWVSFGSVSSSIIAAIALILNARFLNDPKEFGIFSVQFSLILLLARIFDLGTNLAIQRSISKTESPTQISHTFQTGIIIKLLSWILCLSFCLPFAPLINQYLFPTIAPQRIIVISFLVIFTFFYDYFVAILQGLHRFKLVNIVNITLSSLKLSGILLLYIAGLLTGGTVFWLYGITSGLTSLLTYNSLPWGTQLISKSEFIRIFRHLLPVIRWTSMGVISAAIADNADVLMIQSHLNDYYQSGIYSSANRIATFASLIGMSLGTVASIRVAKFQNQHQLSQYFKKATYFGIAVPILMSLAAIASPLLIYFTSGPSYMAASSSLSILLIATGIDIAVAPLVALFYLFEKPQYYFFSGLILTITLITFNILLIPYFGILGSALAKLITRAIVASFTIFYTYRAYKQHQFTSV